MKRAISSSWIKETPMCPLRIKNIASSSTRTEFVTPNLRVSLPNNNGNKKNTAEFLISVGPST